MSWGITFIISGIIVLTLMSEIKEIGDKQVVIKHTFGKEFVISYNNINSCIVSYSYRGAEIEVNLRDSSGKNTTHNFLIWRTSKDVFFSRVNKLAKKCDVYVERWPRFWKKERWKQIQVSSTWVPFDERDKKNTNA
jgi:hypothetical protein